MMKFHSRAPKAVLVNRSEPCEDEYRRAQSEKLGSSKTIHWEGLSTAGFVVGGLNAKDEPKAMELDFALTTDEIKLALEAKDRDVVAKRSAACGKMVRTAILQEDELEADGADADVGDVLEQFSRDPSTRRTIAAWLWQQAKTPFLKQIRVPRELSDAFRRMEVDSSLLNAQTHF